MNLVTALRLEKNGQFTEGLRLALVGAGGKSSAMFRLARELQAGGVERVFVSASTHLGVWQLELADRRFEVRSPRDLPASGTSLPAGVLLFAGPRLQEESDRTAGLSNASLDALAALAGDSRAPLLVEADGSRQRPLKAPAEHEPAIPGWANLVVVTAGLSGLGKPLDAENVHRPEIFARLAGLAPGQNVHRQSLVRVLCHTQGGLKGIPPGARRVVLLAAADTPERQGLGNALSGDLLPAYHAALIAHLPPDMQAASQVLAVHERVAGVVLAAGESRRLGRPKQLLDWQGEPFVRRIARTALAAGLAPVVVVTGAHGAKVRAAVEDLPVVPLDNPDWESGQSSSIIRGVRSLPAETGAAAFLLSDQPQVPAPLIRQLVGLHARTLASIVAPQTGGRRANPVLFDRRTFPDLLALRGDTGGRAIFARHPVAWMPWHDETLLLDVDTEEDYRRLLETEERAKE